MFSVLSTTSTLTTLKNSSYVLGFIASVEWLGYRPESVVILLALMLLDLGTGLTRARKQEGGSAITSASLKRGITAKLLMLSAMVSVALTARGTGIPLENLAQGMMTILMLGELYSILGNIHSSKTGKKKVEFDAVSVILNKVKTLIDKLVS